jgi:DNA-directed RNA polymerase specialized sigma24 family protein
LPRRRSTTCTVTCSWSPATPRSPKTSPARRSRRRSSAGSATTQAEHRSGRGCARATALDHFRAEARRRRREERYALDEPSAETTLGVGFSPELDSALRSLTAAEREVLALRIVLELDAEAAARVLGIGRSALSMRLARALGKLEERMESHALA